MSRKRTQATATDETVVAASQTEQTPVQDGGQTAPVTETPELTTEVTATEAPEVQPSLVVVNNSPSLMPIPVIDAIIEPYGSHIVPEWMFEDSDRITRLKTEALALNEAKGYEMIELRFSVATAE